MKGKRRKRGGKDPGKKEGGAGKARGKGKKEAEGLGGGVGVGMERLEDATKTPTKEAAKTSPSLPSLIL